MGVPANTTLCAIDFLSQKFSAISVAEWQQRFTQGQILNATGLVLAPEDSLLRETHLHYYRSIHNEPELPFKASVIFQDDYLVVADKPHFMPVTPGGRYVQQSLLVQLKQQLNLPELSPLHRIDRETAGLVLFSVQAATRGAYHALFSQREVTKQYDAVVHWRPGLSLPLTHCSRLEGDANFMQMREVPGEPNSQTQVELKHVQGPHALLGLTPHTGKRHQLRVHCAALGMPILHDLIYPQLQPPHSDDAAHPLQLLARALEFRDPLSGRMRRFDSGLSLSLHSP